MSRQHLRSIPIQNPGTV